jgi:pentose-5-phosphate-3-epimerase
LVTLSGSVLAAAVEKREAAARWLADSGHWVHADVIEGSFRGQPGLSRAELVRLSGLAHVLDIHLMVDEPQNVMAQLPLKPRRLTIQLRSLDDASELMAEVWLAIEALDPDTVDIIAALEPGGILVMLTPPGAEGRLADLDRLEMVLALHEAGLICGVDGGVTGANLSRAVTAGARYAVSGRALLQDFAREDHHGKV